MQAIEMVVWLLGGLLTIAAVGVVAWFALRDRPAWQRWSLVLGALAVSVWFTDIVASLLLGWTLVAACSLLALVALRRRPRWLARIVFVVVSLLVVLLLNSSLRLTGLFRWSILLSALAVVIWMAYPSTASPIRRTYARGLMLWTGLLFLPAWMIWGMTTFERTISSALRANGHPRAADRIRWEARRIGEDPSWLSGLPAVSDVRCVQALFPDGACCLAKFPDGRTSEIHIYRTQFGRYAVRKFTEPAYGWCRNPDFDPRAASGDSRSRQFVPCDPRLSPDRPT